MKTIETGFQFEKQTVADVGVVCELSSSCLVPDRFLNGTYAILVCSAQNDEVTTWVPDTMDTRDALAYAIAMPVVRVGLGSGVIYVHGQDNESKFLIKLFFNAKKMEHYRLDELTRCD